jgi:predicted O-methyltransferase YrrM
MKKKFTQILKYNYCFVPIRCEVYIDGVLQNKDCYIIPKEFYSEDGLKYLRIFKSKDELEHLTIYDVTDEDLHEYFYEIVFTNMDFVKELGIDHTFFIEKNYISEEEYPLKFRGMSDTEKDFMYNFVQKIKPQNIMEFSCAWGYSTFIIAQSLIDIGMIPKFFETHEIDKERITKAKETLKEKNINFVNFKEGDVFKTLDKNKLKEVDFLFIDADHETPFAIRYTREFLPFLKKGCWVGVHDIRMHNQYTTGETIVVQDYLERNKIETYFHIADLAKEFKITAILDPFEHCCRSTLFFFRV